MLRQFIAASVSVFCLSASLFSQNLNTTFRSKMSFPGQTIANVWGFSKEGKEYALIGASQGLVIADITNPDAPIQIVQIPGPNNLWKEIKTYGHYAYVVSEGGSGVQIVDLSGLPSANLNSKFYTGNGAIAGQLGRIHALHIDEKKGFLYAYGGQLFSGGAVVLSLSDPWNPNYVGNFSQLQYIHDGYVDNDTMYSGHIYAGQFAVVDMTNKANPVLLATQNTPNAFTHNTWLSDDRRTLLTTDERNNSFLTSYDVSDPGNISELDRIQSNPGSNSMVHNTHIKGDFAVTSWYKDGFTIVDIARPDNLVQVGNYDTHSGSGGGSDGCWGVYPFFPSGNCIASNIRGANNNGEVLIISPNYVHACWLEGKVTSAVDRLPLVGAKIEILNASMPNETIGASGVFKTGRAVGGVFTVKISKSGFQTIEREVLLENGVLTYLDIVLFPVGSLNVSGKVQKQGRTPGPIENAEVFLYGLELVYPSTSDADGNFQIQNVFPGVYDVVASHEQYGHAMLQGKILVGDSVFNLSIVPGTRRDGSMANSVSGRGAEFEKNEAGVSVLPNPFHSFSTLYAKNPLPGDFIEIYDINGKTVERRLFENGMEIGKNLVPGIWGLVLRDGFGKIIFESKLLKTQ